MRKGFRLDLRWTCFPLHPETPEEGRPLEEIFLERRVDLKEAMMRLNQTAASLGLPFAARTMICNSRRAQELGKWAESLGVVERFHRAVYRAYFAEGVNIGKIDALVRISEGLGLPSDEARRVLEAGIYAPLVDEDWERSRVSGVTAVPTLAVGGRKLVGAQPLSVMEQFVLKNGVERRQTAF